VVTGVCVSVYLSTAACRHYCTDPDVTWGMVGDSPPVVYYWAGLQSVHGLRCYGNITRTRSVSDYVLVLALCLVIMVIVDAGSDTAVGCREYCAGEEVRSTVVSLPATYGGVKELCEPASPASSDYMNKIRKRLNDDATARVEREKRRRKVLVQQLTAHHALQVSTSQPPCLKYRLHYNMVYS